MSTATGFAHANRPRVAKRKQNEKKRAENMMRGKGGLVVGFCKNRECSVEAKVLWDVLDFIR